MGEENLLPSDFSGKHPWNSALQNCEDETSVAIIIGILAETGNTWRKLTYEEYVSVE